MSGYVGEKEYVEANVAELQQQWRRRYFSVKVGNIPVRHWSCVSDERSLSLESRKGNNTRHLRSALCLDGSK